MGTEFIEQAPEIGAHLQELGGWGVAVVFMGLFVWLLRAYFKLQGHVLKLSTVLSATNSKTVASLNAVSSKMERVEDGVVNLRTLGDDVKEVKGSMGKVNERLVELCTQARGGGA